jgi:hypothetical protein
MHSHQLKAGSLRSSWLCQCRLHVSCVELAAAAAVSAGGHHSAGGCGGLHSHPLRAGPLWRSLALLVRLAHVLCYNCCCCSSSGSCNWCGSQRSASRVIWVVLFDEPCVPYFRICRRAPFSWLMWVPAQSSHQSRPTPVLSGSVIAACTCALL